MTNDELSAKVAEVRGEYSERHACETCLTRAACSFLREIGEEEGCFWSNEWEPKPYATDMGVAWELVSEIRKSVDTFEIFPDADTHGYAFASFKGKEVNVFTASAAPRAICKAYLKWKGVE